MVGDLQIGDDRSTFLAQAGLVQRAHMETIQRRRRAQHLIRGDDAGAADAHE